MSYPINKNINPYQQQQTTMGVNNNPQLNLQNVDPNAVSQNVVNNSVLKGVSDNSSDGLFSTKTFLISLPVWIAMCFGMDKFNKACADSEKGSLMHRVAAKGDVLATKFKFIENATKKITELKNKFINDFAVPKHKITYSIFKTSAKPENSMAIPTMAGPSGEIASDAVSKLLLHKENNGEIYLGNKSLTKEELEKLAKRSHENGIIDEIIQICKDSKLKVGDEIKIGNGKPLPFIKKPLTEILPITKGLLVRKTTFSEYINKLDTLKLSLESKTLFGKALARMSLKGFGGVMQGMSGGKFGMLMGAYFIAEAIKKGIEAPKGHGEKRKTFTENFMYNVGFMLTMPLAAKMMYGIGGMKYIGMTKDQVEAYRSELKALNERVLNKSITKTEYQEIVKTKLVPMLKGDLKGVKGLLYKPFKIFGRLWDIGLENRRPFTGEGANIIQKTLGRIPYTFRRTSGFVLRFALFNFVFSQILAKLFAQGSNLIFGKPSKSILDEGKEDKKTKAAQPLIIPQQDGAVQQIPQTAIQSNQQNNVLANNQFVNIENKENIVGTSTQKNVIGEPTQTRRYIPSEDAVKIEKQKVDVSQEKQKKADDAQNKAKRAENNAQKYLR